MKQRFFDTLEADLFHQQFDQLHRVAVDSDVQRTATHVVDTVDVERECSIVERLTHDWNVTECCGVQKHSLLVRQLYTPTQQIPPHIKKTLILFRVSAER